VKYRCEEQCECLAEEATLVYFKLHVSFTLWFRVFIIAATQKMAAKPELTSAEPPPFVPDKHRAYIKRVSNDSSAYEFAVSERTQPSLTRTTPVHHSLQLTNLSWPFLDQICA